MGRSCEFDEGEGFEISYDWGETVTRVTNIKVGFVVFTAVTGKYCPAM
jgi:hypothetical protein